MSKIKTKLKEKILVLDGAMGTELHKRDVSTSSAPEYLNINQSNAIKKIHKDYILAGSDIVQSNTFGANRVKLAEYNLADRVEEINQAGVKLVKQAAQEAEQDIFISGSIGPTGKLIKPIGDLAFKDAIDIFTEQALALEKAGADLVNIETMSDIQELKAAIIAVKENTNLEVIANLTFNENLTTMTGTDPQTAVAILEAFDLLAIGANCSLGPKGLLKIIKKMRKVSNSHLIVQPNAGLPELKDGETFFPLTAQEMAEYIDDFITAGISILGGCCGSGPDYISLLAEKVSNFTPEFKTIKQNTKLTSRSKAVSLGAGFNTRIIGERINPTGRDDLTAELKENKTDLIAKEAKEQVNHGADFLDINIGAPGVEQKLMMQQVINRVQQVVDTPLVIDTTDPEVLEVALQTAVGKPLINSVTGEKESLENVLPLAKKYGAAVLGLPLNEDGIPDTTAGRVEIAEKIINTALDYGIKKENILLDGLVLTAGSKQELARVTLETLKAFKNKLNVPTVLGLSNISYGLPRRGLINATFLAMAINAGLDAPIMDPTERKMVETLYASDLLANNDQGGSNYLAKINQKDSKVEEKEEDVENKEENEMTILEKLHQFVLKGNKDEINDYLEQALKEYSALEIINQGLIPGITEVGDKYETGEYFLPQLMMSAETMELAFTKLKPILDKNDTASAGKILLATVKGDIHDIGKNIVRILLKNNGFEVIDLGKDVPSEKIVSTALEEKVDIVGLSALMTTTMPEMAEVTKQIKAKNDSIKIMLGGAVVTEEYTTEIGADGYAENAISAVKEAKRLI